VRTPDYVNNPAKRANPLRNSKAAWLCIRFAAVSRERPGEVNQGVIWNTTPPSPEPPNRVVP
jgi:hypothetical protein